jgi:hypothetical protein
MRVSGQKCLKTRMDSAWFVWKSELLKQCFGGQQALQQRQARRQTVAAVCRKDILSHRTNANAACNFAGYFDTLSSNEK